MSLPATDFDRTLAKLAYRHHPWRAFTDFAEMTALAFANSVLRPPDVGPAREERFARIRATYTDDEYQLMTQLLAHTVSGLEDPDAGDFLGDAFMRNELGNHYHGQFFTPFDVSRLVAELTIDEDHLRELVATRGYVTAHEPAAGSGGMLLALAFAMRRAGLEPQRHLLAVAIDIAPVCAHMTLIQLSLHAIPAIVYVGDTLSGKMLERFETPAYHLGLVWPARYARLNEVPPAAEPPVAPVENPTLSQGTSQLSLW